MEKEQHNQKSKSRKKIEGRSSVVDFFQRRYVKEKGDRLCDVIERAMGNGVEVHQIVVVGDLSQLPILSHCMELSIINASWCEIG